MNPLCPLHRRPFSPGPPKPRTVQGRRRVPCLLASLLLCFLFFACDNFERNAYRTLKLAKVEYELLQDHAAHAYLDARISQQQWDRFAVAGNRFIAAHTLAADLMKTYQQSRPEGPSGIAGRDALRRRVAAALADMPVLLADLRALLASFETPRGPAQP